MPFRGNIKLVEGVKMKRLTNLTIPFFLICGFAFCADDTFQGNVVKKPYDPAVNGNKGKPNSTQILYHGGPIMNLSNSVYVIYYGNFAPTTQPIINDFLVGLSGSSQYGVNTTYGTPVTNTIPSRFAFTPPKTSSTTNPSGSVYFDNYSQGSSLGNKDIPVIVAHAINAGLAADQNGVYLLVTAPDVKIAGFCNSFCAYHTTSTSVVNGLHIRYALIPDPTQRCSGCNGGIAVYGDVVTPNLDMGADSMTDDIMHELSETVTDPDLTAWFTQGGAENGDLCNYVYETSTFPAVYTVQRTVNGTTYTTHANAFLNGRDFLVQFIWKNSGAGFCSPK
jgi:hypothetical protein